MRVYETKASWKESVKTSTSDTGTLSLQAEQVLNTMWVRHSKLEQRRHQVRLSTWMAT